MSLDCATAAATVKYLPLLVVTVFSTHSWSAEAPRQVLTPEIVLNLSRAVDVQIAPDARDIVYRVNRPRSAAEPRGGGVGELWLIPATGGQPSRVSDVGFNAHQPRWSPDGSHLAWIAQKDPYATAQVYFRRRAGGKVAAVTAAQGSVAAFEWSPDGGRIAFTAADPETAEEIRAMQDGRDWYLFDQNYKQLRLYTIDLTTKTTTLVTRADLAVWEFAWSPDSSRFAIAAAATPLDDERLLRTRPYVVSALGGRTAAAGPDRRTIESPLLVI